MVADFSSIKSLGVSSAFGEGKICINVYGGAYCSWLKKGLGVGMECVRDRDGNVLDIRSILIEDLKNLLGELPVEFGVEESPCDAPRVYALYYDAEMANKRVGLISVPVKTYYALTSIREF